MIFAFLHSECFLRCDELYRTFKGLRPLRLNVADFQWGFKSPTENVFNERMREF
jgi:hypothetical protein